MSPERWEEVGRLFTAALEIAEGERETFAHRFASASEVAEEVVSLLRAHARTGLFDRMEPPGGGPAELEPGTRLGPWEVVSELGRGGMGLVYLVRRADGQFETEAALKILSEETRSPDAGVRFLAERQLLAHLSHPHIAKLLDGGVSDDGRPWFAMERIQGEPLDRYCDRHHLTVTDRVRLLMRVCEAVQYAHERLIVHRDLKPWNILVTADGEPKLLDFGIARMLDPGLLEGDRPSTRIGLRLLTPEYASPEQLRGDPVTTASDVYQLGLLLRRLLVGGDPERAPGLGSASAVESVSPWRSLLVREDRESVAAARSTTPERLARAVRGDLEAIAQKALRREPDRRYGSAGQLADDLGRFLDGWPVRARPEAWRYVAGKFVRRHALPLAGAAAAFLLASGMALGMWRQAERTAVERDRAEQVVELLVGLFRGADPVVALDDSVTVREVLDQGADRVRSELEGQPAVQATLMSAIAEVYESLGLRRQAIELMEEALATGERAFEADDPALAGTLRRLAVFRAQAGDVTVAESLVVVAEARLRSLGDWQPESYAEALTDIGYAWQVLGDLDRAEPLLEESLAAWAEVETPGPDAAAPYTDLGWIRGSRGDLDSAQVLFRKGLAMRTALLGPDHPTVATSLEGLAWALTRAGALSEADSAVSSALAIRERALPHDHPGVLSLLAQRADILRRRGMSAESGVILRVLLETRTASGAPEVVVAGTHNDLALVLQALGSDADAEAHFRSALEGYRATFGGDHLNPAIIEANLARLLVRTGGDDEAKALFEHSLPIMRAALPIDARFLGDLGRLGTLRCGDPDPADALALLREAAAGLESEAGRGADAHLRALGALAECLERQGRREEAIRVVEDSLDASAGRDDSDPLRGAALAVRARLVP